VRRYDGGPADEPSWHDREPVALAAGVAAFVLLALLGFAVLRTSREATEPAPFYGPVPSNGAATTTTSPLIKTLTSSSYPVPSVQTSQYNPPPAPPSPSSSSEPPPGGPLYPEVSPTIFNPYAPPPSSNAGHL
jgi:hypothetical protein